MQTEVAEVYSVLNNVERSLVSLSPAEIDCIVHALKFRLETGAASNVMAEEKALMASLISAFAKNAGGTSAYQKSEVWADAYSVMIRAITVFGDAVEMSTTEAKSLILELKTAIEKAS